MSENVVCNVKQRIIAYNEARNFYQNANTSNSKKFDISCNGRMIRDCQ